MILSHKVAVFASLILTTHAITCDITAIQARASEIGATLNTICAGTSTSINVGDRCELSRTSSNCDSVNCLNTGKMTDGPYAEGDDLPGCLDTSMEINMVLKWFGPADKLADADAAELKDWITGTMFAGKQITSTSVPLAQLPTTGNIELTMTLLSTGRYTRRTMYTTVDTAFKAAMAEKDAVPQTTFWKHGGASATHITIFSPIITQNPTPAPEADSEDDDALPVGIIGLLVGLTLFLLLFFLGVRCYLKNQAESKAQEEANRQMLMDQEEKERMLKESMEAAANNPLSGDGGAPAEAKPPITEIPTANIKKQLPMEPTLAPLEQKRKRPPVYGDPTVDSSAFNPYGYGFFVFFKKKKNPQSFRSGKGKHRVVESAKV